MSGGWIEVTGRRSFKRTNNPRNRNNNPKETSSEPDETKVQKKFERIIKEIQTVYDNSTPFLSKLLKDLKSKISSNNLIIYALGCGTIENTSMVLAKSCLYQWSVCLLLTHFLKPSSVHIFDPVMSKTDHLVWNKLKNYHFKFKKNDQLDEEFNLLSSDSQVQSTHPHFDSDSQSSMDSTRFTHSDLTSPNSSSHTDSNSQTQPSSQSTSLTHSSTHLQSQSHSKSKHFNIILWMPHCEKFLYKGVLEGILDNKCPLKVCQTLAQSDQVNQSNEHNDLDGSNQSNELEDLGELVHSNNLSLENTILVGNSLSDYSLTDLSFKDSFALSETALLPFELHPQSFNDTFITTFSKI